MSICRSVRRSLSILASTSVMEFCTENFINKGNISLCFWHNLWLKSFCLKCRLFILKIILSYFGFHWPLPGDLYRKCYIIGNVHDFKSSYYLIVLDSKVVFSYYRFVKFCFPVAVLCFGQKRILYKFDIHENPSWTVKPWKYNDGTKKFAC